MLSRKEAITRLRTEEFDALIIGGGITGAGIALDAASRGLNVALIEKEDFASGTSSKSTKLIHGGLRYLKQLNFALVAKTGRERSIIHRIAPHLVLPDKMLLPFYKGGTFGKFSTRIGLFLYDTLAGVSGSDRFKIFSAAKTRRLLPMISNDGLLGSGFYAEYRTDDARLTIENVKKAAGYGAICTNYCMCSDITYKDGVVNGVVAVDVENDTTFEIKAKKVVNAAGPWVDKIRGLDEQSNSDKKLILSKGIHLVFDRAKFKIDHTVYFDKGDGRLIFAVPRNNTVYVGTTDTIHKTSPDQIDVTQEDVNYIMEGIHNKFPKLELTQRDILSTWAGVRPLIHEEGKDVTEISRKDEIFLAPSGLITIAGGKLTGYRHMAEDILKVFIDELEGNFKDCHTDKIQLTERPFKDTKAVNQAVIKLTAQIKSTLIPDWMAAYLIYNYGNAAFDIIEDVNAEDLNLETITMAELSYCISKESVRTLLDFYERRTGRLYFEIESILPTLDSIASLAGTKLNWNKERIATETESIKSAVNNRTVYL